MKPSDQSSLESYDGLCASIGATSEASIDALMDHEHKHIRKRDTKLTIDYFTMT